MEALQLWLSLILGGMAVLTNIFLVYNHFAKKDNQVDRELGINGATCSLKHKIIDQNYEEIKRSFADISKELNLFKVNGLTHIEERMNHLDRTQVKILTILEERSKEKI